MVPEVSIGVDGPKKCRIWKIHYFDLHSTGLGPPLPTVKTVQFVSRSFSLLRVTDLWFEWFGEDELVDWMGMFMVNKYFSAAWLHTGRRCFLCHCSICSSFIRFWEQYCSNNPKVSCTMTAHYSNHDHYHYHWSIRCRHCYVVVVPFTMIVAVSGGLLMLWVVTYASLCRHILIIECISSGSLFILVPVYYIFHLGYHPVPCLVLDPWVLIPSSS